ncbi:MAG: hypothetical protein RL385_135 [Pseudomonadota bacterium]|jgi:hypothetical protein
MWAVASLGGYHHRRTRLGWRVLRRGFSPAWAHYLARRLTPHTAELTGIVLTRSVFRPGSASYVLAVPLCAYLVLTEIRFVIRIDPSGFRCHPLANGEKRGLHAPELCHAMTAPWSGAWWSAESGARTRALRPGCPPVRSRALGPGRAQPSAFTNVGRRALTPPMSRRHHAPRQEVSRAGSKHREPIADLPVRVVAGRPWCGTRRGWWGTPPSLSVQYPPCRASAAGRQGALALLRAPFHGIRDAPSRWTEEAGRGWAGPDAEIRAQSRSQDLPSPDGSAGVPAASSLLTLRRQGSSLLLAGPSGILRQTRSSFENGSYCSTHMRNAPAREAQLSLTP